MGALAGTVQVLTLMWLRTAINYQYRYGVSLEIALKELHRQGGIARFYNGISYALLQGPLAKFGSIAANEGSKVIIDHYFPNSQMADMLSSALGSVLSMMWRIVIMPIETCKTILQVDGVAGFRTLLSKLKEGRLSILYEGSSTVALLTAAGHYPWFFTHNTLDRLLQRPIGFFQTALRSALIGFIASAVSDTFSNFIRVIKTVKQSVAIHAVESFSYRQVVDKICNEGGLYGLFFRGLWTRILGNGLQSVIFTIIWKALVFYDIFDWLKNSDVFKR